MENKMRYYYVGYDDDDEPIIEARGWLHAEWLVFRLGMVEFIRFFFNPLKLKMRRVWVLNTSLTLDEVKRMVGDA